MSVLLSWALELFRILSLLIFLSVLSITGRGGLKFPVMIVYLFYPLVLSVCVYLEALIFRYIHVLFGRLVEMGFFALMKCPFLYPVILLS